MKIAEVSERYGISADTLRYYERIGLIPPVNRNGGGIRDYSEIDVRRVEFIKCMRSAGLPIEVLIEYVGLVQQGDQTIEARKEILKEQREQLVARMKEMIMRKVCFITGAGRGMGVNIAKVALAAGNAVIATGITKEARR